MGISGRIAQAFLRSKLTPLLTIAALAAGVLGIVATPREEEPQISVPMIDVIVALPGASPTQTENLLVRPLEKRMRSEEHTSELQSRGHLVCRLLLEKKK